MHICLSSYVQCYHIPKFVNLSSQSRCWTILSLEAYLPHAALFKPNPLLFCPCLFLPHGYSLTPAPNRWQPQISFHLDSFIISKCYFNEIIQCVNFRDCFLFCFVSVIGDSNMSLPVATIRSLSLLHCGCTRVSSTTTCWRAPALYPD